MPAYRPALAPRFAPALAAALLTVACGGSTPEAQPPSASPGDDTTRAGQGAARQGGGPSVEQEIGALDEHAVTKTFAALTRQIEKCQDARRADDPKLDFLSGDVRVEVRVKADGSARYAYLAKSTLGDRGAEKCIANALKGSAWPKPEGGEGLAKNEFGLPMKGDRDAVAWEASKVSKQVADARSQFASCGAKHGAIEVTAYVDRDGSVIAAGASQPDAASGDAADCAATVTKGLKFSSPGGWPAKVTFSVP